MWLICEKGVTQNMAKRLGWTFVIGGALGVLSQIIFDLWSAFCTDPNFVLSKTLGSDDLVTMGIVGAILGGLGIYRHLDKRSTFGAGLPFSGFAFGIGMNMIGAWTKDKPESFWKCTWKGLWMVIWFNVLVFALCFFISGIYYYGFGIHDSKQFFLIQPLADPISGPLLYLTGFIAGGIITCIWEFILIVTKAKMVRVLATAWCIGCLLAPTGIISWLGSWGGWGAQVMIMNGGLICYNISFMFFNGIAGAGFEFASLVLTVCCLFLTGWLCFIIHILKYGHKPQNYKELEAEKANAEVAATAPSVE